MQSEQPLQQRIERARELLRTVRHAALATVNEDGTPHNSPVFAGFGGGTTLYWASSPNALHSCNIARTGQAFVVLFDSMEKGGGLYMQCQARMLDDAEIDVGLAVFNTSLARLDRAQLSREQCTGGASQRLYCAMPLRLWVNMSRKDREGRVLHDERYEIRPDDLRAAN